MHVKQALRLTVQRRKPPTIKTVHVMRGTYDRALPYGNEDIDGKLRRKYEESVKAKRCGLYLARNGITFMDDEIARAVDVSVRGIMAESFVSGLVELFIESMIRIFPGLIREAA